MEGEVKGVGGRKCSQMALLLFISLLAQITLPLPPAEGRALNLHIDFGSNWNPYFWGMLASLLKRLQTLLIPWDESLSLVSFSLLYHWYHSRVSEAGKPRHLLFARWLFISFQCYTLYFPLVFIMSPWLSKCLIYICEFSFFFLLNSTKGVNNWTARERNLHFV